MMRYRYQNIFRRLRENRLLAHPLPVASVVYSASLEVVASVVYASFIVALFLCLC